MKYYRKFLGIISALLIIAFLGYLSLYFLIVPLYNNFLVSKFLVSLENIKLSPKTRVIASNSDFGIIWGAGNHCDVIASILIETEDDITEVSSYKFAGQSLDYPFSKGSDIDYSSKYLVKDSEFYFVYQGKIYQLAGEHLEPIKPECCGDFSLERREVRGLRSLAKKIKKFDQHLSYYVIEVTDQTYSGISFQDYRCH